MVGVKNAQALAHDISSCVVQSPDKAGMHVRIRVQMLMVQTAHMAGLHLHLVADVLVVLFTPAKHGC